MGFDLSSFSFSQFTYLGKDALALGSRRLEFQIQPQATAALGGLSEPFQASVFSEVKIQVALGDRKSVIYKISFHSHIHRVVLLGSTLSILAGNV